MKTGGFESYWIWLLSHKLVSTLGLFAGLTVTGALGVTNTLQ